MPEPLDAAPSTGPVAGKYELVRLIGRGGMGTVWEGRHISLGTRVAIKFIDVEYADSQEARTRFDNEARAAATIQSKHAIQIFDHGVTNDGKPYIVMEMLQGEPLDARLDRVGRLSLADTARILRQVSRALSRAHERGIVHRDLKPENIFLVRTPDDDDEIAKVLDFGIAKFKKMDGQSGGLTSSTKTGAVLGTPFYMAPEQARGLRDLDHRVDLWSMGVIAFKCVCGVLPFEGVSVGDLLVKICTTPAPVPSSVVHSLGPPFDAWFQRALQKDPALRFQSALELSDALAGAAGLSVKRAASQAPNSDETGAVAAASNRPPHASHSGGHFTVNAPGANATSAPFTASSPRAAPSSRGLWIGAGVAVAMGIALGAGALVYRAKEAPRGLAQSVASTGTASPEAPAASSSIAGAQMAQIAPLSPDASVSALAGDLNDLAHDKDRADKADKAGHHHPTGRPPETKHGSTPTTNIATLPPPPAVAPVVATPVPAPPRPATPQTAPKPTSNAVNLGY